MQPRETENIQISVRKKETRRSSSSESGPMLSHHFAICQTWRTCGPG